MIAFDTNLLVYAHRPESPFHDAATALLSRQATAGRQWALPWPCAHEFLAVVTNPRIYRDPTPMRMALDALRALFESPGLELLSEDEEHLDVLADIALAAQLRGAQIHDARIAALCRAHGVSELWSADRDFSRFPGLKVRNPLLDHPA